MAGSLTSIELSAVTRYNDIMTVELDHASYSSQLGGTQLEDQPAGMKRPGFIRMDPPRHTAQRKTVAPVAAPNNLASYETTIRQRTRVVLDALPRNETFNWVDKVSIELTTMMLATLFDFPWEDRRKLTFWSDVAICDVNAPNAPVHTEEERFAELLRMAEVFKGLWKERAKAPPRLDLISMMAHNAATSDMPRGSARGRDSLSENRSSLEPSLARHAALWIMHDTYKLLKSRRGTPKGCGASGRTSMLCRSRLLPARSTAKARLHGACCSHLSWPDGTLRM
jgi:hypothetical protein